MKLISLLDVQHIAAPTSRDENQTTPKQANATNVIENVSIQQLVQNSQSELGEESMCFPWLRGRSKFSRLEFRAAFSMSINVLPVWLCTFPVALNAIALYWCIRMKLNCSLIFLINPYICDLFLIHCIYNPVMYMSSSTEFWRAMSRFLRKWI